MQIAIEDCEKQSFEYFIEPKACPFCGTELKKLPKIMIVPPVRSEEYLLEKLQNGRFLGSDNYFNVVCIQCGAIGPRGLDRIRAIENWNKRN